MGKVYDALKRAEEQRARVSESAEASLAPLVSSLEAPARRRSGRSWLRRLLRVRARSAAPSSGELNKRRIALLQPQSFVAEQFRTLRARLDALAATRPLRTLAVASAIDGDGKTTAAINLALVMSMGVGRRVLLVDCDLRCPTIHESLGLRVGAGLGELLRGTAELDDALCSVEGASLTVLPVRALPLNPSELLASSTMRELIAKLSARFDTVLLDLPPTLGLPDAKIVSELCDGVLFVMRAGVTPREDVEASLEVLGRSRVVGLVLNGVEGLGDGYGA